MESLEPRKEIYLTFAGPIDTEGVKRIFRGITTATKDGHRTVHLLLHSEGGAVSDGIALYNYLRASPIEIVTYNAGLIASIAVLVFLAGSVRKASANAAFLIHKSTHAPSAATTADAMEARIEAVRRNDAIIEKILHANFHMPEDKWRTHAARDLIITAQEAVEFALIHEIGDFAAPMGSESYAL